MKIVITGANGYIGANLVKQCLDSGHDVLAVDINKDFIDARANYKNINIFSDDIDFINEFENPDALIHLAWRDGFVHNSYVHLDDLPCHYKFLKSVIESGIKYISVLGTAHEIGYFEGAVDDNTPCNPMSLYGISKNALRQSLHLIVSDKNTAFHWLRAFYIIGDDLRSNSVFGKLLRKANNGEKSFPLNSGKNKYDFITVEELSKQILAATLQDEVTGIINVCSGKPVSLGEQIESFIYKNKLNIKINYGVYPDRAYDSPIIYGNADKIKRIMELSKDI